MSDKTLITSENYNYSYFSFEDRQAGIGHIFCPKKDSFNYNVYCVERKLLKEIFSIEYDFLDDAINAVNQEFGQWERVEFKDKKSGCGNCAAK